MPAVTDAFRRPLRDLRVSLTDRCMFRCPYCMPREVFGASYAFLPGPRIMTDAEVVRIARAFRSLGVEKVRLTGGEPLLRPGLPALISSLKAGAGIPEIALTTNGWLLGGMAADLRAAGLDRITVSVDSLRDDTAGRMNGLGLGVGRVLAAIDAAAAAGLPVKVNCVVQRGVNDGEIPELCAYFRARGHTLRFIEFMDVGNTNAWEPGRVVPVREIRDRIAERWPLEAAAPAYRGEVAARYRYADGAGEIGLIGSVTEPFCADCHRARLSADGRLYTCLFASVGWDILGCLRAGEDDEGLVRYAARVWGGRMDRYSDERAALMASGRSRAKVEMSYIGG